MNTTTKIPWQAFTIFGFTREIDTWSRRLSDQLAISPRTINFGNAGHLFFYASSGEIAGGEEEFILKLGFARTRDKSPLSTQQLLDQKIVTPDRVDFATIKGNYLVAGFSKTEAKFIAYKNLLSSSQLYYWKSVTGDLIAADNLGCLVAVLEQLSLNEEILPFHFMFRHAPGTLTYYKDVSRLFPGQLLTWKEGSLATRVVQDLRFANDYPTFDRVDPHSVNVLYQELKDVVGAYISDIRQFNRSLGNLLSGGVDSSLLQLLLNEQLAPDPVRSFSFAPERTPSFEFEIEYARSASERLNSEHTFVNFSPESYPDLVIKAIEILGQPVLSDVEPCKLALAQYIGKNVNDLYYFFVAGGADTLFGLDVSQKLAGLELCRKVPGSRLALAAVGTLLSPFTPIGQTLAKGSAILSGDPHLFFAPLNTTAVYSNLEIARRSFGDEVIRRVLEYKRSWEELYLNTSNYLQKVHVVDLFSETYEIQVQSNQLFLANNKEQIYPFMDDDIIRISLAFKPQIRYIKGLTKTKPLLKAILEQNGLSSIARRPKGGSVFTQDLYAWMKSGPLHDLIREIKLPGYLSQADFERLVQKPDRSLWSLLTYDIFQKKMLNK